MADEPGLRRSLGLLGLTFIAVGGVLGSGWLFAPMLAAKAAGPASIVAWLIGGCSVLLVALTFAEVCSVLPLAGGIARLPHVTHGGVVSVCLGWTAWLGYCTSAPVEASAMLTYLGGFFPSLVGEGDELSHLGDLVAVGLLALFVVVNAWGAKVFESANTSLTWLKLTIPLVLAGAFLHSRFEPANFTAHGGFSPNGLQGILAAVSSGGVLFALLGFRHAIDMAGEVRRPQVTIPAALTLAVVLCAGLYVLLQVAFLGALPPEALQGGWSNLAFEHHLGPLAAVASSLGLAWATVAVYGGAVAGPFGGALVATGSNARLAYALSQVGLFPSGLQELNRRGVPVRALLVNLAVGALLLFAVPFEELVTLNAAAITLSLTAGPLSLYALRSQLPEAPRTFRLPAVGLLASLAFLVTTLIMYWSGWHTMMRLGLALGVGLGVYLARLLYDRVPLGELHLREAAWLVPYLLGLFTLSYLGNFGGGRGALSLGWELAACALLSVGVFHAAFWCRLPREAVVALVEEEEI